MAEWRVVDLSPGYERLPVRIYEGVRHVATVFDAFEADRIVTEHNRLENGYVMVSLEPTLEQQKAGYDALKALYPEEYKKENPVGHYRVYEAMVEEGRVR